MGSSSFPAGRRVLVVDADHKSLKYLEKTLRNCHYQVTSTNLAQEALDLLQQDFDIVICDVNITDMDAYQFLPHVLKLDLPIILMSVDGEDSSSAVLKGVQHGACDYLIKPIRQKEVRYIWQHVIRKRVKEVGVVEGQENRNQADEIRKAGDGSDGQHLFGKKRKETNGGIVKKQKQKQGQRVVWGRELHERFLRAVEILGDKCGPKGILELMAVPGLTRENVASHLQKHRISKSRKEKGELKAGVLKFSDTSPEDYSGSHWYQSAVTQNFSTMQHNTMMNAFPIFEEGDVVGSSRIRPIEGQNVQVKSKSERQPYTNGLPPLSYNNQSNAVAIENACFLQQNFIDFHSQLFNMNPATVKNLEPNGYSLPAFDFSPVNQQPYYPR